MEAKYEEITLGEPICIKIKQMYFSEIPWPKCYREVAEKLTLLKKILRKFYNTIDNVEVLKKAIKFTEEDIKDVFSMKDEYLKDETTTVEKNKYAESVQWIPVPRDKPYLIKQIKKMLEE